MIFLCVVLINKTKINEIIGTSYKYQSYEEMCYVGLSFFRQENVQDFSYEYSNFLCSFSTSMLITRRLSIRSASTVDRNIFFIFIIDCNPIFFQFLFYGFDAAISKGFSPGNLGHIYCRFIRFYIIIEYYVFLDCITVGYRFFGYKSAVIWAEESTTN